LLKGGEGGFSWFEGALRAWGIIDLRISNATLTFTECPQLRYLGCGACCITYVVVNSKILRGVYPEGREWTIDDRKKA